MLIQWCLKGITEQSPAFDDSQALLVAQDSGITSAWMRNPSGRDIMTLPAGSHRALSSIALDSHVNGFGSAKGTTPYISLSAGCVELDPGTKTTTTFSALNTALTFATESATQAGYVFRLWVLVSPKPAAELPGFGEEVRELNIFRQYCVYHEEGEIAAKLFIPARQIEYVEKYDRDLNLMWHQRNPNFVSPERVSNVLDVL
jgi:hypothetical protein